MKRTIRFVDLAVEDLDSQAAYIADHEDAETARAFLAAANETVAMIATHPSIGRRSAYETRCLGEMRMIRVVRFAKHLVFYRIESDAIAIVRVVHGARDLGNLLED
ncbi:MAG: type II toxin-antitoxin system RelE/ParE family toxin [Candidatus Binataceae bacterium]